jgi:hypothetical protein
VDKHAKAGIFEPSTTLFPGIGKFTDPSVGRDLRVGGNGGSCDEGKNEDAGAGFHRTNQVAVVTGWVINLLSE